MKRSLAALVAGTAVLAAAVPASAVTTITTANGLNWQIHDFAPPKLDTGSIRAITDNAFYGFGGIRVRVSGIPATDTTARFNGERARLCPRDGYGCREFRMCRHRLRSLVLSNRRPMPLARLGTQARPLTTPKVDAAGRSV